MSRLQSFERIAGCTTDGAHLEPGLTHSKGLARRPTIYGFLASARGTNAVRQPGASVSHRSDAVGLGGDVFAVVHAVELNPADGTVRSGECCA